MRRRTVLGVLATLPLSATAAAPMANVPPILTGPLTPEVKARMYSVVILTIKDPEKYKQYLAGLSDIVTKEKLQTKGERILKLDHASPTDPENLNIVYYAQPNVREQLRENPEFQKIVHLRDDNADILMVDGYAIGGDFREDPATGRVYNVELVYYKDQDGATAYQHYLEVAVPVLKRYGFHIERTIVPTAVTGGIQKPDLVNVIYFESAERMAAVERDPRHAEIEGLYAKSVKDSRWFTGSAAN